MSITDWSTKDHLGQAIFKKAAGEVSNGNALTTEVGIPYTSFDVVSLENNTVSGVANASAGPVNYNRGKSIVRASLTAPAHSSWFLQKNLNDWGGGAAGFLSSSPVSDTSTWDFSRYEPVLGHRRYTGGKCESITVVYNANGGPVNVIMTWLAIYQAEQGSPASFATPTRVTGKDYDTGDVSSTSLDLLRSFTWTMGRGQAPQNIADGTYLAAAISSHGIGGSLSVEQSPTASQGNQVAVATGTLSGTIVFQIGPATTGVKFTSYVVRSAHRRMSPGNAPGTEFWDYDLVDAAGTGSGYPFIIAAGV